MQEAGLIHLAEPPVPEEVAEAGEDSQLSRLSLPVCLQLRTTRQLLQRVHLAHQLLLPVHSGTLPLRRPRLAHHLAPSNLHLGLYQQQRLYQHLPVLIHLRSGPMRTQAEVHFLNRLLLHLDLLGLNNQLSVRLQLPPPPAFLLR